MRFMFVFAAALALAGCAPDGSMGDGSADAGTSSSAGPLYTAQDVQQLAEDYARASGSSSVSSLELHDDGAVVRHLLETTPVASSSSVPVSSSHATDPVTLMTTRYERYASLDDVSGGTAFGIAQQNAGAGEYALFASYVGLPELPDGASYEAWLVRTKPFASMRIGVVSDYRGAQITAFTSAQDLRMFDRFVVTLPNPKNPGVAGKAILEGVFRDRE